MNGCSRRSFLRRSGAILGVTLAGCLDRGGPQSSPTHTSTTTVAPTTATPEPSPTSTEGPISWTFETGDEIPTAPKVAEGIVFVASKDRTLFALDEATGEERWRYEAEGPFRAVELVRNGVVVARSNDGGPADGSIGGEQTLHALDVETGELRWKYSRDWMLEVLGERNGTIYVGTSDDAISSSGEALYALSLDDGTQQWSAEIGDPSGGLVTGDAVYVPVHGRLYVFDAATGRERWTIDLPDYFYRTLVEVGDVICYVARNDDHRGVLHARDVETGEERWRFEGWFVSSTTSHDGGLYAGGERIAAFDPASGTPRWSTDTRGFLPQAPVYDGTLYAGGDAARAIAVSDGTLQWSWTPAETVQGLVPAGVGHGAAYFDSFREADPRNRFKFAVEADSGSNRCTFGPETDLTDLAVGDERVVVGGANGIAYGLSP